MAYLLQLFQGFDPLEGELPSLYAWQFMPVAQKARFLIADTPLNSLNNLLFNINQILEGPTVESLTGRHSITYRSHAINMRNVFEEYASEEILLSIDLPKYYAVIALAQIGFVCFVYETREHYLYPHRFDEYVNLICEEAHATVEIAMSIHRTQASYDKRMGTRGFV